MRIEYDTESKDSYIYIGEKEPTDLDSRMIHSIQGVDIYLDYNEMNECVGIHILGAGEPVIENI